MYQHTEDYAIDEASGEIFVYTKTPYAPVDISTIQNRHYTQARDVSELIDLVKQYKEKRYGEVSYFLDKQHLGKWYIPVLKMCSKVVYFNVGFYERKDIADILMVKESSVNKTLNKLVDMKLLTYTGKGLSSTNQIRVVWNPFSVWKGWLDSPTRTVAIQSWYKRYFVVDNVVDSSPLPSRTVFVDDAPVVYSPDPYVSKWFNMMSKDIFNDLMNLSDVEFELFLLGSK